MKEEIFGPILPIITFRSLEQAVELINDRDKPLALYLFSSKSSSIAYVRDRTSSGAFTTNDTMSQAGCNTLPFGGVGPSGIGGYHGAHSFEAFSHLKPCLRKFPGLEFANDVRVAPFNAKKLSTICWLIGYPKTLHRSAFTAGRLIKLIGILGVCWALVALRARFG